MIGNIVESTSITCEERLLANTLTNTEYLKGILSDEITLEKNFPHFQFM